MIRLNTRSPEDIAKATMSQLEEDDWFLLPGNRNDACVNLSIACWILGKDPETEAKRILVQQKKYDMIPLAYAVMEKLHTISEYKDDWCGKEMETLDYAVSMMI